MEKKLLVIVTIALCAATGLEAARTVTVPSSGPKMAKKTIKPNKHELAMDTLDHIFSTAKESVYMTLETMDKMGLPMSTKDHDGLVTMIKALTSPTAKMAGIHLQSDNANKIYTTVKNAFYKIKDLPNLMPGQGFGMADDLAHQVIGMISAHYVANKPESYGHVTGKDKLLPLKPRAKAPTY